MRIAYVCADRGVPIFGNKGCSIHVREVISALVARGAQIDLFAARLDGERPVGWQNVRIHALPLLSSTDPGEREQMALASNEQITAALRKTGPFDMIYERYSQPFFDGDYRVLRGGSWAVEASILRPSFRNWDHPFRRQIFSGVRLAWDAPDAGDSG